MASRAREREHARRQQVIAVGRVPMVPRHFPKQFLEQWLQEIRDNTRYYIFNSLTIDTSGNPWLGPDHKTIRQQPADWLPDYGEIRYADDECVHWRLPGDRTPPCGCWPQEGHGPMENPKVRRK